MRKYNLINWTLNFLLWVLNVRGWRAWNSLLTSSVGWVCLSHVTLPIPHPHSLLKKLWDLASSKKKWLQCSPWPICMTILCENMLILLGRWSGNISLNVTLLDLIQSHIMSYFYFQSMQSNYFLSTLEQNCTIRI
jgi:hypothetical protein